MAHHAVRPFMATKMLAITRMSVMPSFLICLAIEIVAIARLWPARRRTRRSHGAQPQGSIRWICCNGLLQMILNF